MYKTKEEAIEKLEHGNDFRDNKFDLWRGDFDVAMTAVNMNSVAFRHTSEELQNNPEIAKVAIKKLWGLFELTSEELQNNPEIAKVAIKKLWGLFELISDKMKNNPEIAKVAIKKLWGLFELTSDKMKNNPEVVKVAVEQNGWLLEHASKELRNDVDVVLSAVKQNGFALRFASPEIQELCKGQNSIEVLTKLVEIKQIHAELQKDLSKPKEPSLDFAKKLSQECKEHAQSKEQSLTQAKPKARMKI